MTTFDETYEEAQVSVTFGKDMRAGDNKSLKAYFKDGGWRQLTTRELQQQQRKCEATKQQCAVCQSPCFAVTMYGRDGIVGQYNATE